MKEKKIITVGTIRGGKHQQDIIIDPEGISRALVAGTHSNAQWMMLIWQQL